MKWKRRNNKTLLERKIKKMTDSKSIKSNEKTVLWAINRSDSLDCRLSYKKHSCKYCFFHLIETDRLVSMDASQARKITINFAPFVSCRFIVDVLLHLFDVGILMVSNPRRYVYCEEIWAQLRKLTHITQNEKSSFWGEFHIRLRGVGGAAY